jgi:hypothetical protein
MATTTSPKARSSSERLLACRTAHASKEISKMQDNNDAAIASFGLRHSGIIPPSASAAGSKSLNQKLTSDALAHPDRHWPSVGRTSTT